MKGAASWSDSLLSSFHPHFHNKASAVCLLTGTFLYSDPVKTQLQTQSCPGAKLNKTRGLNLLPPSVCSFIDSRALWELIYTYIYINTYIHCFNAAITLFVCCLLCVTSAASHQHNTLTVTLMLADSSRIYCCSSDSAHAGLPQQSAQFEVQNKKSGIITTLRNTQRHQSSTKTDYHSIRFL